MNKILGNYKATKSLRFCGNCAKKNECEVLRNLTINAQNEMSGKWKKWSCSDYVYDIPKNIDAILMEDGQAAQFAMRCLEVVRSKQAKQKKLKMIGVTSLLEDCTTVTQLAGLLKIHKGDAQNKLTNLYEHGFALQMNDQGKAGEMMYKISVIPKERKRMLEGVVGATKTYIAVLEEVCEKLNVINRHFPDYEQSK